ncbi:MAG: hypothetical protein LBS74_03705 [Oscillospiraceae bacterium]|jgi:hypothetical protein|nr:hypothetical protein [Oscillospiraceae bacterium]
MKRIADFLKERFFELALVALGIVASSFIAIDEKALLGIAVIAVGLVSASVIIALISRINRQYTKRFKNESDANRVLIKLLEKKKCDLNIMSKVGTTIFDLYESYLKFLSKEGTSVSIILTDPNDTGMMALLDRIFNDKKAGLSVVWRNNVDKMLPKLNELYSNKSLEEEDYNFIREQLTKAKGYADIIRASSALWQAAAKMAGREDALHIYYSQTLPDVKAWIFNNSHLLAGYYHATELGVNSHIYYYKKRKKSNKNRGTYSDFRSYKKLWEYKIESLSKQNNIEV